MIDTIYIGKNILPILAYLNLTLIFILTIVSFKSIKKSISKIKKKYWVYLAFIILFGLIIRIVYAPMHHLFFIDESFSIVAAKNISFYFKSFISTGIYPKQIAWPAMIAISFLFFVAST